MRLTYFLPLLVGEGGAKRRVRVYRVFRCVYEHSDTGICSGIKGFVLASNTILGSTQKARGIAKTKTGRGDAYGSLELPLESVQNRN
jgi:hypothetical protein